MKIAEVKQVNLILKYLRIDFQEFDINGSWSYDYISKLVLKYSALDVFEELRVYHDIVFGQFFYFIPDHRPLFLDWLDNRLIGEIHKRKKGLDA